ncbi:hypothetical protein IQ15_07598 [Bradyrhizobium yuanmingense]|nr:hypothetical protein IQ15_07598 [Bradyrhizobium yuanmingense]
MRGCDVAKSSAGKTVNRLYFGDNLDVLREYVDDESVDLVYRRCPDRC